MLSFAGQNGKYLHFHDDGLSADSEEAQPFHLELRDPTRMCIKTAQGRYVNGDSSMRLFLVCFCPARGAGASVLPKGASTCHLGQFHRADYSCVGAGNVQA